MTGIAQSINHPGTFGFDNEQIRRVGEECGQDDERGRYNAIFPIEAQEPLEHNSAWASLPASGSIVAPHSSAGGSVARKTILSLAARSLVARRM